MIDTAACPPVLGGPDDLDAVVCGFVAKTKSELLVALQELDSLTITTALLAAKKVQVRCGSSSRVITSSSRSNERHRDRGAPDEDFS
jgi:hypothetical protein